MSSININGASFKVTGNNIVVDQFNGTVKVNGVLIQDGLKGIVEIKFEGDLASLNCNTATISGSVHGKVDANTLKVTGDITGDVDGNTVHANSIKGDVDANTINCKTHTGDIKM